MFGQRLEVGALFVRSLLAHILEHMYVYLYVLVCVSMKS